MARTVIVVPCFNEANRLAPEAFRDFARNWRHGMFLFVDDGSTDTTFAILTTLQKSMPTASAVLQLPHNVGKAEAVRQGVLQALQLNPEYVGFWDSDLATPLDALPLFESVFRDRPQTEIVLGARVQLLGRDIRRRTLRHYLGRGFATAVAIVLSVNVYDSQCGAKMFRVTDSVRGLFNRPFLSRWIFDVEILARFVKAKRIQGLPGPEALLYELPLPSWRDVGGSKLRAKDFVTALFDLVRICRSLR
jgi:dolichyl-phosphate beta-glucosyltransferase